MLPRVESSGTLPPAGPVITPGPGQYLLSFTTVVQCSVSAEDYVTLEQAQQFVRAYLALLAETFGALRPTLWALGDI